MLYIDAGFGKLQRRMHFLWGYMTYRAIKDHPELAFALDIIALYTGPTELELQVQQLNRDLLMHFIHYQITEVIPRQRRMRKKWGLYRQIFGEHFPEFFENL